MGSNWIDRPPVEQQAGTIMEKVRSAAPALALQRKIVASVMITFKSLTVRCPICSQFWARVIEALARCQILETGNWNFEINAEIVFIRIPT